MTPEDALWLSPKSERLWQAASPDEWMSARDIAVAAGMMAEADDKAPAEVYHLLQDLAARNLLEGRQGNGYRRRVRRVETPTRQ